MSTSIYTTQIKLNEILDIGGFSMPDDELFDLSDYPNNGIVAFGSLGTSHPGKLNPMYGKKHTEETKKKIREARARQVMKPISEEHKKAISEANTGNKYATGSNQYQIKRRR